MSKPVFWLNERQWNAIEKLLPIDERGPRCISDRSAISGIIQVLRSQCAWRMCPTEYGPYSTILNRYQELRLQNIWPEISAVINDDFSMESIGAARVPIRYTQILHVDDEPDIREVVEFSLNLNPALVTQSCSSGREALTVAANWQPNLILLDVMMPGMDGTTTLERLRTNPTTAGIVVVFMTARARPHEIEMFRTLGVAGVITKPFDPMTLADSIRAYI